MLNHKFYIYEEGFDLKESEKYPFIRVSNNFLEKMSLDLKKHVFTSYSTSGKVNGLSKEGTLLKKEDIKYVISCLKLQSADEKEHGKLNDFLEKCLQKEKDVLHVDGRPSYGGLKHEFVLVDYIPKEIHYRDFKNHFISIQDQFIRENYKVFSKISMNWEELETIGNGFNYYGTTIISPNNAKELLDVIEEYLYDNSSEEAEYFVGEEYETLKNILKTAVGENQYIVHFGI